LKLIEINASMGGGCVQGEHALAAAAAAAEHSDCIVKYRICLVHAWGEAVCGALSESTGNKLTACNACSLQALPSSSSSSSSSNHTCGAACVANCHDDSLGQSTDCLKLLLLLLLLLQ
jgi:hypothetical protein